MPYRPSRARRRGWSSRAVWLVAGHGVGDGHRVRSCPSPGPASRMARCVRDGLCRRIVCRRARRWPVAGSRAVGPVARSCVAMFRLVSATSVSLPCPRSGIPKARHLPCPGPTYACSRRRQPLCCEHIFACTPWRFMNARSAARLRRIVGRRSETYVLLSNPFLGGNIIIEAHSITRGEL